MADISKIKLPDNTTYNINAATVNGHTVDKNVPSDAVFTDTNTHRPIQVNGTQILGNNTTALNLIAGDNVSMTNSGGTVTISSDQIDDTYDYDDYQDLPDSIKMQDKIFMVKDAPNPPAIPIVDEYAREQIVDVKSNLTELLNIGTLSDGYQFAIVDVTVNNSVNSTYSNRLNVSAASDSSSYSNIANAGYEVFCLLSAYAQRDSDGSYQVAVPAHPFGFTSKTWVYVPVYVANNSWTTHYTLLCRKVN